MASVRMASRGTSLLENQFEELADGNSSYFIDTNSFSAHDFDMFVNSLEVTYNAHFRSKQLDHTVEQQTTSDEENEEYSIYESLSRYAQADQISSYGGTPMSSSCFYPSTSEESLLPPDAPHNTRIREERSPIAKRKSFLNIFQYFDQDVTLDEDRSEVDDSSEVEISCQQRPRGKPDGQADVQKKVVLREWDTNVEHRSTVVPQSGRAPKQPIGRLNAQLLKMFEGENDNYQRSIHFPAPRNNNNKNNSKSYSVRSAPVGEKKVPIMQHNHIEQPKKLVNGEKAQNVAKKTETRNATGATGPKQTAQSQPNVDGRRVMNRPVSTSVKIVNAAPKVQHATAKQCGTTAATDQRNLNEHGGGTVSSERDKCYVRNINDLFLQYRSRERSENGTLPNFNQHVREAIEEIEKIEENHVRSVLGQHAFDQAPPAKAVNQSNEEEIPRIPEQVTVTTTHVQQPSAPRVEDKDLRIRLNQSASDIDVNPRMVVVAPKQESALDMHYRLRHETYRLQMHNLIETDHFVRMNMADRNQLYLLDTIFNRSHLSLIHTVLALIQANISKGDQVLLETRMNGGPITDAIDGGDTFVDAIGTGSYRIDAMTTSAAGENCVELEVIAVDEMTGRMLKITVEFVIDVADKQTNVRQRKVNNSDEFHFVVRLVFEVNCKPKLATSFYTVDCGMYWDRDRVLPFLRKCASTVRRTVPPENELQKSHETGTNLSEHQLRVQASLQRLNIPDWYKQYSGKDGPGNTTTVPVTTAGNTTTGGGGILRKRNSDVGRWTGLSSKTTSLSSLGSHRSDRSPVMLSPSAHSHHGQTGFSRWSTSHLNSNQTSPSVSTRGSFTRGGLNASVISGYSTASTTAGAGANNSSSSTIRNSFRQPYLGWRSQEKLSQPRTPAERLASSLLQQQGTNKQKDQQQQLKEQKGKQQQQKDESVVTPEIQSSIIEVTSAIVHYVNDQTNRHSRSRSTSPSQRCWLESSFVGTRPLDSPQTPLIENSSVLGSDQQQQQQQQQQHVQQSQQPHTAGDHYRFNAGRMNGVG
uniref:Uncharacterized protein n=1 Tax=Anopheles christyi TaxID=43041 RepID=A0A182K1P0_9DIPT